MGYIENESEYDVCTDETVSNTVVMYVPPTRAQDKGWYERTVQSSFFVDTATPRSNDNYFVQIIASGRDLGDDIDEWERRGKIVKTYMYNTDIETSGKYILNDENGYDPTKPESADNPKYIIHPDYYIENPDFDSNQPESEENPKYIENPDFDSYAWCKNPEFNTFDSSVAQEDMFNSREKGLVYYVVVAYFADNSRAMSKVYSMQGF